MKSFAIFSVLALTAFFSDLQAQEIKIAVDLDAKSSQPVSPYLFGRFFELNGRDAYPGFISQHLANGSFEQWNLINNRHVRDEIIFKEVEHEGNVAYPWQQESAGRAWFALVANGVHGKYFQRIINPKSDNEITFYQKTALPDQRTLNYKLEFYCRSNEDGISLNVGLAESNNKLQDFKEVELSVDWKKHDVMLKIDTAEERFQDSPFGVHHLVFSFDSKAIVDLDHVMLSAGDAVNGKFNPTTMQWMKDFNVTTIRWPGGNYASMYKWTDAVGPWDKRPVSTNDEWGGLEPNYFGTNEFLEFCKLSGVEPYINVPFNLEIASPEYLAQWVEYVNGDTTTAMGKLRAEHGYPEPWNAKYWQVGNEHYGIYQAGFVFADTYAQKIKEYVKAMKAADPEITVYAAGADPLYTDHEGDAWNETLLDIAGNQIDGIDIHRYVNRVSVSDEAYDALDPYVRAHLFVAFPSQYELILEELIKDAKERGKNNLMITIGEWNLSEVRLEENKVVDYPSMPHAAFVAGMYNVFMRQGEWVKFSHQRDNTLWFRPYHNDFRPVNPGSYVLQLYAEPFRKGEQFFTVQTQHNSPGFSHPQLGKRMLAMDQVPFVDVTSVLNEKEDKLIVFLTNRNLKEEYAVSLELKKKGLFIDRVSMKEMYADPVFTEQSSWEENQFHILESQPNHHLEKLQLKLKPSAVVRLEISMHKGS